jgi:hypothetical protein
MCTRNTVLQPFVFKNKTENVVHHNTEQKTEMCKAVIKLNLKESPQKITDTEIVFLVRCYVSYIYYIWCKETL